MKLGRRKRILWRRDDANIEASQSFSTAHVVGYFDTIEEMHKLHDRYNGHTGLSVDAPGWRLAR